MKMHPSDLLASSLKSCSVILFGVLPRFSLNIDLRACSSGNDMYIRFSNLLRIAASNDHGIFVAPNTKMLSISFPTPFI